MLLHTDRYNPTTTLRKNGVVVHDSEGGEGLLGTTKILASAQLIAALKSPGDRPSPPSNPGGRFGAGYHFVACENGTYTQLGDASAATFSAPPVNATMWHVCIPGKASQTRDQWLDVASRQYIHAVALCIVDCWNHDGRSWPLTFVGAPQLVRDNAKVAGHPTGYTSHAQISQAWHDSDHTDPGVSFPWDVLANDISSLIAPEEDDMQLYKKVGKAAVWLADGKTRQWVDDMNKLSVLQQPSKYGAIVPKPADFDLDELGQQVLSFQADI